MTIHERELRISEMAVDLKIRCDDNDSLKIEFATKDAELSVANNQINDLKQVCDFKLGENEKLIIDKN